MTKPRPFPDCSASAAPLSVEQLEAGLRILDADETDLRIFWGEHIDAFRQTVLFAILETSTLLLSASISSQWRAELENQLDDLVRYIELADRYMLTHAPSGRQRPSGQPRIH